MPKHNLPNVVRPPSWLEERPDLLPTDIVVCQNGLLHIPTRTLLLHTPNFFANCSLTFSYDPSAPDPSAWLTFLNSLWGDDTEAIDALQEMFGYYLTADTAQQKIFLIVGPKRSGKGTLARVLTALLGQENVVAPTLASLQSNFGLAPLIGKPLAIISDARLSGRADQQVIAERLLTISGEDSLTIDRKFLPTWTGRLPTRFFILTNELPRLTDASGAVASRIITLVLTRSFYNREDHRLATRLLAELPSILNWALNGKDRLAQHGYFQTPQSSNEVTQELEDLGAPISAFIRDCCEVGPRKSIEIGELFSKWKSWCMNQGRDHPGTAQSFGRDLRAAVPTLRQTQPREGGERKRWYEGIGLIAPMVARDGTRTLPL